MLPLNWYSRLQYRYAWKKRKYNLYWALRKTEVNFVGLLTVAEWRQEKRMHNNRSHASPSKLRSHNQDCALGTRATGKLF